MHAWAITKRGQLGSHRSLMVKAYFKTSGNCYRKSKYSKYWRVLSREWNASQIDIYGLICFQSIFKLGVLNYDLLICCDWSPLLQNDWFCIRIRNKETFMGFIAKKVHIIILIMKLFIGFDNMYIYSMHFLVCICMVFQYLILLHCNLLHIKHVKPLSIILINHK